MAQPWLKYQSASPPVTLGQPDPYKARDQELQEAAAARSAEDFTYRRQRDAQQDAKADKPKLEKLPLGASTAIQENLKSLHQVEESLKVLDTRPASIGPGTGMLGDTFTQWNDPQGVDVRAKVGNIGAVKIHDLSGAAVSATEAPRFQPFVPAVTDLPDTAKKKLGNFRDQLKAQVKEQLDYSHNPANGYLPYSTPQAEEFLKSFGQPGVVRDTGTKEEGFDLKTDPRATELTPDQRAAYEAFWKANPNPTPEQLEQFGSTINVPITNAKAIIEAKKAGRGVSSTVETRPDISDMRGQGGFGEKVDAAIRGAADTASFGLADKAAAVGDTIFSGGTYDQNQARQYAISDYDTQQHFPSRTAGQVAGGFVMPLGEIASVPQLVGKGAAAGAAYGTGSSRSLAEVPQNALLGGVAGAVLPAALVGAGRGISAAARGLRRAPADVPPLVDPVTGELNQPMDAMRPADRVQSMRDLGMQTVTPGMAGGRSARVLEQGFGNLPGSAGLMEDVNSAVSRQARGAMQNVAQRFGSSKTLNEGGAELQRGANEWIGRAEKTASRLYDRITISPRAPASLTETTGTLQRLTGLVESNPEIAAEVNDPILSRYLSAMQKGLDWQGLKEFRTFIGAKSGEFRFSQDARKDGYQALYGALSEDMRNTARSLGPRQLKEFERANSFYAAKEQRIEGALVRILGNDAKANPEKAAAAVQAMTRGGKMSGDLGKLAQIKASTIKSGAWDEVASTMIHLGGQPAGSEGRQFNPQTFVNWYADMAEPARRMLFKPDQRKALDGFVALAQQLQRVKGLTNASNTTPTMIGSGTIGAAGSLGALGFIYPPAWLGLAGIVAGGVANHYMARLWTSPAALRIITGYGRAAAKGDQNAVKSQIGRLTKLASTNPELRAPIQAMLAHLNDNAPQAGQIAASPDQGPQNQAQPQ